MSLPISVQPPPDSGLVLRWQGDRLELAPADPSASGVSVDFLAGPVARRRVGIRRATHSLSRAVGRKAPLPVVVDGTAGLGRDAFVLACLGYQVLAFERSPTVHALLNDGLRRWIASEDPAASRITILHDDIRAGLGARNPDVIYLDPMFPGRRKRAQVKKEMQLLQRLAAAEGETTDRAEPAALELLEFSRAHARQRVVLKRPAHAPALAPPHFQVSGSAIRWDVYLT